MDNVDIKNKDGGIRKAVMFFLSLFLVVLTVFVASEAYNSILKSKYIGQDVAQKNVISVAGSSEAYAIPDLALIDFSVVEEAKTVQEATQQNTQKMNAVIDAIKKQGVEDKDLKTAGYSIYPLYEYIQEACIPPCLGGKRVLSGYEVSQTVEVKIRDLAKTGQIIEAATNAGSNQAGDLQFTVENPDQYTAKARAQAIAKALEKAQVIAAQLNVKLGRITAFNEGGASAVPQIMYAAKSLSDTAEEAAVPQIQTGQNKIEVSVSVTYEIN